MKKSLFAGLMLSVAMLGACSGGDTEPVPANVVNTSEGLTIELEWTTGGTTSDAKANADLDLFLLKGETKVATSASYSFESVLVQDVYADAEYVVRVLGYEVAKNTNYTLYVKGDDEGELKSYEGVFNAGDTDLPVDFLKIRKSGTTYTITEL